jgi:aminotransferase
MSQKRESSSKMRVSRRVNRVAGEGFGKFLDLLHSMSKEGLISLSVGEPDFGTPEHAAEEGCRAIREGWTKYTPSPGFPELRQAVSQDLEKRYGIRYDPESEIIITVGVSEAMDLAFRATLDPGDEVILSDPYYVCYPSCIGLAEGVPVFVPTTARNAFQMEYPVIKTRVSPRTKVILFGNPANPTGTHMGQAVLAEIARVAEEHDLLVVSDEIYSQFSYGMEHCCFASLPGMKERTILLDGFAKRYAMPGWRLGYAAGPADLIAAMGKIHQHTMLCPPSMSQWAALAALKADDDQEFKQILTNYDRRRRFLVERLTEMGLDCPESQGAFYVFPSVRATGMTSDEFAEKFLMEEKVMVLPGTIFGEGGEGFVRICYAKAFSDLEESMRRMERFVKRIAV